MHVWKFSAIKPAELQIAISEAIRKAPTDPAGAYVVHTADGVFREGHATTIAYYGQTEINRPCNGRTQRRILHIDQAGLIRYETQQAKL